MMNIFVLPPLHVAKLLRRYQLKPNKRLGQVFLEDASALERVIQAAQIPAQASVLEIGAGLGSLTRYLALNAAYVTAVEIDPRLLPVLNETLTPFKNVNVVCGDILEMDLVKLIQQDSYSVVANIPYYITSAIVRYLLESKLKPSQLVLTIQREVAERICALPGSLSLLALSVQVYGNPRIACRIPAGAFFPPPKVDSAVLHVDLYPQPRIPPAQIKSFFRLIKAAFAQKRKTLRNALAAGLGLQPAHAQSMLEAAHLDAQRRAETLNLDEWQRLVEVFEVE